MDVECVWLILLLAKMELWLSRVQDVYRKSYTADVDIVQAIMLLEQRA